MILDVQKSVCGAMLVSRERPVCPQCSAHLHPMLFLLRQNGSEDKGWRGTPFYWPVIRAQQKTPTAIYTAETVD